MRFFVLVRHIAPEVRFGTRGRLLEEPTAGPIPQERAMSQPLILCVLPSERVALAAAVASAGGTPVVDLSSSPRVEVPEGAWVRVRERRAVPGTGPVILVGGGTIPVRNRETWLEVGEPGPVPAGFAGLVLRGEEAGGPSGLGPGKQLVQRVPQGVRVILDCGVLPADMPELMAAGIDGVVVSEVLMGLPEYALPSHLREKLSHASAESSHVVNGFRFQSSALTQFSG